MMTISTCEQAVERNREDVLEDLVAQAWAAEFLTVPDLAALDLNKTVWARALSEVPTADLEPMFYAALEAHPNRVPRAGDVLQAWQVRGAARPEHRAWRDPLGAQATRLLPDVEASGLDEAGGSPALPVLTSLPRPNPPGPGRLAWEAHLRRIEAGRGAVVCDCGLAARLTADSLRWCCPQSRCGFTSGIGDQVSGVGEQRVSPVTRHKAEANTPPIINTRSSPGTRPLIPDTRLPPDTSRLAADCNIDLDRCTPEQVEYLAAFAAWWGEHYECGISWTTFNEYRPLFEEQLNRKDAKTQRTA